MIANTLTAHYQQAHSAGDRAAAAHTAALMAAVADPTLRTLLTPHLNHTLTNDEQQWANQVRAGLRARRAARWRPVLDALDTARRQLQQQLPAAGVVTPAHTADHDQALWYKALADWLNDGASAPQLAAVWHTTAHHTARTLIGLDPATNTGTPTRPPWTHNTPHNNPPDPAPPAGLPPIHRPDTAPTHTRADDSHDHTRGVLARSAAFYHRQLRETPEAQAARRYLHDRGINEDDWTKWQLGWAPNQWRGLCDALHDDAGATQAGVANHKHGRTYDVMRGRIVFPIRDLTGDVIGFAGRRLPEDKAQPAKYVNTRTTALYHKTDTLYGIAEAADSIHRTGTAGIVEGYTDTIAAHKAGLTNVVATGGVAFTPSHLTRIRTAGAHHLIAAFDGDDAGQNGQQQIVDQAHQTNIPATAVTFPPGEDPASLSTEALLTHWQTGLPQPWTHISRHLNSTDLHDRATGQRTLAATYTNTDPVLTAVAAHQTLLHTRGAIPTTLTAWQQRTTPHHRRTQKRSLTL